MNTFKKLLFIVVAMGFYGAGVTSAEAQVRVYKVTFNAKARVFPSSTPGRGNSFKHTGYIIYAPPSIGGPAAQVVEVFRNKTFQVNGPMINTITPGIVALNPIDRSRNGVNDHEFGTATANGMARSYMGAIPRNGFRLGNVIFSQTAKSVSGRGSVIGTDHFTVSDTWTIASQSGAGPVNTAAGVTLVTAYLVGRGYVQVP